ncbi:MAG TPA: hypothetical protein VL749_00205 [Patescibacteria group bacterium]|nr:hypothetical protein [Patescibacteria group bacterium]
MTTVVRSPVFIVGVVVGLALGAAELVGSGSAWRALLSAGIPILYGLVVTLVGRRRDSLSVLAGRPIDERAAYINAEASTWAFGLTAIAVVAGVAWQIASRGDWTPLAAVAVVMAVAYLGSLFVLELRR